MKIKKIKFYKSAAWRRKRKETIMRDGGKCVQCGGVTRLIVHHITPIQWDENDEVDVESVYDLIDVDLETLCVFCHNIKERSGDETDLVHLYLKKKGREDRK